MEKRTSSWADVRDWLTDATRTVIKEAEDLTHRGQLKMEILSLSHKIEHAMADLGARYYETISAAPDQPVQPDAKMRATIQRIAKLEQERTAKRAEYDAEKTRR